MITVINTRRRGFLMYHVINSDLFFLCSCGPIFGAGADLLISNDCNTNADSYSNLPHSYDGDNASNTILMGVYNFTVLDYEVFTPATK